MLNRSVLQDALIRTGLNQSGLATKLEVSREAVSKWLAGDAFPQPEKLLRMGVLLGLTFDQLVTLPAATAAPVVFFRKKSHQTTTDEHLDNAREIGEMLKRLVRYLPKQELTHPPTLKNPTAEYMYVQTVAAQVRKEMGLEKKEVYDLEDLVAKFNQLQAVIIPVLWGARQHHGNALNVFLPDSQTTWVFLNLDSSIVDFKFWMAHELGHSLAPELVNDDGEAFADSFAQSLLFPEAHAAKLRADLQKVNGIGARIGWIRREARKHVISPGTIREALEAFEEARQLPGTDLGEADGFMKSVMSSLNGRRTVSQVVFKRLPPEPKAYVAVARSVFGSPFFESLAGFCKHEQGAEAFIQRVLAVSLADAKGLAGELRQ